jgi:hypothetical protein
VISNRTMKDDAMANPARDLIDYQLLRSWEIELRGFTAVQERIPNSMLDLFKVLHQLEPSLDYFPS